MTTHTRNSAIADKPRDAFVQYAMAWLPPPLKDAPPHMYYRAEFVRFRSNGTSVITDIRQMIPCVPPFMVTQSHRNRHGSIGYLWLHMNLPQQPWVFHVPFTR